jgi:hypothetical protein
MLLHSDSPASPSRLCEEFALPIACFLDSLAAGRRIGVNGLESLFVHDPAREKERDHGYQCAAG